MWQGILIHYGQNCFAEYTGINFCFQEVHIKLERGGGSEQNEVINDLSTNSVLKIKKK